jgi:hypothetical protein
VLKGLLGARHSVVVQRYDMSWPRLLAMQREVRILKPAVAMHYGRALTLDYPIQRSHRAGIGERRMKRERGIRVKSRPAAAPSANPQDVYAIQRLLGGFVTSLKRNDRDRMAKADQFSAKGLNMPLKSTDDWAVEIRQLKDMH